MTGMMMLYCLNLLFLFVTARAHPERPRAKYDYSEVKIQGTVVKNNEANVNRCWTCHFNSTRLNDPVHCRQITGKEI